MIITDLPSPNHDARPEGAEIDVLVIHYTGMETAEDAYARMCDPDAKVSAHYMIHEQGEIVPLVAEKHRAWHAGKSSWRGREAVNDVSIGIELVNPGHEFGYQPFPQPQIESLVRLCEELLERHPIQARNVLGHSDIAPTRKEDPGEYFPWEYLALEGIGVWPDMPRDIRQAELLKPGDEGEEVQQMQQDLADFGYAVKTDSVFGIQTSYVVTAFARHFTPHHLEGTWTKEQDIVLCQLLEQVG